MENFRIKVFFFSNLQLGLFRFPNSRPGLLPSTGLNNFIPGRSLVCRLERQGPSLPCLEKTVYFTSVGKKGMGI